MQTFKIHFLGCGSALPTLRHNSSCQIVEMRDKMFMIDCGEGTQTLLRRSKIRFTRLQAIFISHLHGDHCFGLMGMISSFGLLGRTAPLHIYAYKDLEDILKQQINYFCYQLDYEVVIHPIDTDKREVIFEDRSMTVETIPLEHRMPCCGFLFKEKEGKRHINRTKTDFYKVPQSQYDNLRNGYDWVDAEGETINNKILTTNPDPVRSYAYCSDTRYMPELHKQIMGVTVLYHESTYANDRKENAKKYYHSTAEEAAMVARDAQAGKLILGHYSQRYDSEKPLLEEAKHIFDRTYLSNEGLVFNVE